MPKADCPWCEQAASATALGHLAHTDAMHAVRHLLTMLLIGWWCVFSPAASAADLERGRQLYNTAPQAGLLACMDCHGEKPQEQNFGNIWAGRHAAFLIERAISINTGGMGYFGRFYDRSALSDIAAWLGTAPASLTFADTKVGTVSASRSATLSASTKAGITGLSLRAEGDYTVSAGTCSLAVDRFAACSLEVSFSPSEPGLRKGALFISHDGSPSAVRIELTGMGLARTAAVASLGPARLNFGPVASPQVATLRNDSDTALIVQSVQVGGPGFRWAGGSCVKGLKLAAKASCSVLVTAPPDLAAEHTGWVSIGHDGQGGVSTVELHRAAGAVLPRLVATVKSVDLGTIGLGEVTTSGWVAFVNQGPGPLIWNPPSTGHAVFSAAKSDCEAGTTMAIGATCRVKIAFSTARAGRFTSTLRWTGGTAITPEVPISGVAVVDAMPATSAALTSLAPNSPKAAWAVDQVALAMGGGPAGTRVTRRLTVHNLSNQPLNVGRLAVTGDWAGEFDLTGDCQEGRTVPAGQTCQIEVSRTTRLSGESAMASLLVQAGSPLQSATILLDVSATEEVTTSPPSWLPSSAVAAATDLQLRVDGLPLGSPMEWGSVLVGQVNAPRSVTLLNRSTLASPPLMWRLGGPGSRDWSVSQPASPGGCTAGQTLAPGAQCTLLLSFTPTGPGRREAWLFTPGAGESPGAKLQGVGLVTAAGRATAQPAAITFQASPAGVPPPQSVVVINEGAAAARVASLSVSGVGFRTATSAVTACPEPPFDLLPGLSCNLDIQWTGTASGAAESTLRLMTGEDGADLRVPLTVAEDPLLRTNEGGSGGAVHGLWWLGLACAAGLLHRSGARRQALPSRSKA